MIKIEHLEENPDLEVLLEPKKRIYDLVLEVNGSMLNFHKTIKTSKEIEALSEEFFQTKKNITEIRNKSAAVSMDGLTQRLARIKPMKSMDVDFI